MATTDLYCCNPSGSFNSGSSLSYDEIHDASSGTWVAAPGNNYSVNVHQYHNSTTDEFSITRGLITLDLTSLESPKYITEAILYMPSALTIANRRDIEIVLLDASSVTANDSGYGQMLPLTTSLGSLSIPNGSTGHHDSQIELNEAGRTFLETKLGSTAQIGLRVDQDIDDIAPYDDRFEAQAFQFSAQGGDDECYLTITYSTGQSITLPDIKDDRGRIPKGARVEAYRADTHAFIGVQYVDGNGSTTFSGLPVGEDMVFHATWGGISDANKERWYFLQFYDIDEGGTGATTPVAALSNLGLGGEDSPQFAGLNIGHASDTTLTRVGSGRIAVEGVSIVRSSKTVLDNMVVRFKGTTGDLIK